MQALKRSLIWRRAGWLFLDREFMINSKARRSIQRPEVEPWDLRKEAVGTTAGSARASLSELKRKCASEFRTCKVNTQFNVENMAIQQDQVWPMSMKQMTVCQDES